MDAIVDKVLILIMCSTIMMGSYDGEILIGCMLVAIVLTALFIIFDSAICKNILTIVVLFILIAMPEFVYFIPIFAYDVVGNRDKIGDKVFAILFEICTIIRFLRVDITTASIIFLLFIISVWMKRQTKNKNIAEQKLIQNRDNSFELTEALKNKNRMLLENQEYEIHNATLSERNRIAREIHDNVGHMLSRSILQVGALMAIHKEEKICEELVAVRDTLDSAMNSIRESVHDLHNASIDLEASIKEAVAGMKGYDISFMYEVDENMDDKIKNCLLSTVKEALSNVHKHSNGNRVWININEHPAFYQCIVKDNGTKESKYTKGLEAPGIGLGNIQSRVESLGGKLLITNDDGYRLFIMIPKTGN